MKAVITFTLTRGNMHMKLRSLPIEVICLLDLVYNVCIVGSDFYVCYAPALAYGLISTVGQEKRLLSA